MWFNLTVTNICIKHKRIFRVKYLHAGLKILVWSIKEEVRDGERRMGGRGGGNIEVLGGR